VPPPVEERICGVPGLGPWSRPQSTWPSPPVGTRLLTQ